MKKKINLTGLLFLLLFGLAEAQPVSQLSPDGIFDVVYDRFGNRYNLKDIRIQPIPDEPGGGQGLDGNVIPPSYLLCTAGYFNLYFEQGSGCELGSTLHTDRRDVICQLFTDISEFITPADPSVRVNIWIRNIGNVIKYPMATPVLGLATSFYTVPNINVPAGGIIDGEIWKTINTGKDGFINVASPLNSTGTSPGSGAFYHGMLALNFSDPGINWHTDLTTATAGGTYDLYTTALHEITHALGFASLIGPTGQSKFGPNAPFYSRYDLYLKNDSGVNLIGNMSLCSMYDYFWNGQLSASSVLNPNISNCIPDRTFLCSLAVKYDGSVLQSVYTPNCYENGSSLSHFEDECLSSGSQNNTYFCMSNASSTGPSYMQRYLQPEEKAVLCDLGYKVDTAYGDTLYIDNHYYYGGTPHPGLDVAGVNDGIDNTGAYQFSTVVSGNVNFTGVDILGNDYNADEFECLEVINGLGTVSTPAGNAGSPITFNAGSGTGVALLRYIPVNTLNGERGNITYVHVYVHDGTCVADACNMLINAGFENGSSCGNPFNPDFAQINCWEVLIGTPDYFVRNCTPIFDTDKTIPTGSGMTTNPTDSWNGSGNDAFLGLGFYNGWMDEAEQTLLSAPMQPGVNYILSFWAKSANSISGGFSGENRVMFRGASGVLATQPAGSYTSTGQYLTEATVPDDDEWHYFTMEFTSPDQLDNFLVGNIGNNSGADAYVFIDDLRLTPANITARFDLQESLCDSQVVLDDLTEFVFPPPIAGSSFSGPGVSYVGGVPRFTAPGNGWYTIFYDYTNSAGCSITIPGQIFVTPRSRPLVSLVGNPPSPPGVYCGTPVTLYASGAMKYEWYSPTNSGAIIPCSGRCDSIVVTPPPPGYLFTAIGTDTFGCKDTAEIWVQVNCGGGSAYAMPEDVKHYTTKVIPPDYLNDVVNHALLAGTIFRQSGFNNMHLMRVVDGNLLASIQYPSPYMDERVVDLQSYTLGDSTYWYIIGLARTGGATIVKILQIDDWGNLLDQREYEMPGGDLYPMNAAVWVSGEDEARLYICGYTTPSLGMGMPDYNTNKQAFVMAVDIEQGSINYLNSLFIHTYDWNTNWSGTQDFDLATRIAVLQDGSNYLWVTGSVNGIVPLTIPFVPKGDDRSAVMSLVLDPNGNVMHESHFIGVSGMDDSSGTLDYGIDLIQADGQNYILGNKTINQGNYIAHPQNPVLMYPRANKCWWIQPVNDVFAPAGPRGEFWNPWGHWAAHAIHREGLQITVATLIEYQYSTCIPTPYTPNYDNVQANLLHIDLSNPSPYHWVNTQSKIYRTSSGTGNPFASPPPLWANSFFELGDALTLIDYSPTFAAMGIDRFYVNAPKYDQMRNTLNLKVLIADYNSLGISCGDFDCTKTPPDTAFLEEQVVHPSTMLMEAPMMLIDNPSNNRQAPFQVSLNPYRCYDFSGNPTYRTIAPVRQAEEPEEEAEEEGQTRVYPNPASDILVVEMGGNVPAQGRLQVTLQSVNGQQVLNLYDGPDTPRIEMNVSRLAPGSYVVQVSGDSGLLLTEKIIIKR